MSCIMVDRLHSEIIQNVFGITAGYNTFVLSPNVASHVSDTTQQIDAHFLPMFASYVASARGQSIGYNFNSSNEDIHTMINKLKGQNPVLDVHGSSAHVSLLNTATTTALAQDTNSRLSTEEQIIRAMISSASATNKNLHNTTEQRNDIIEALQRKRRPSTMLSNDHRSNNKKARHNKSNLTVSDIATVSTKLSNSKKRGSFPLPRKSGDRKRQATISISKLPALSKRWDDFEMVCYNMDDTIADQQALVKKLFVQSLHRSIIYHPKDRI